MMIVQEHKNRAKARRHIWKFLLLTCTLFFPPCTIFKSGFNSINLFIEVQCCSVVVLNVANYNLG